MEKRALADYILGLVGIAVEENFQPKTAWGIPLAVVRMVMEAVQMYNLQAGVTMVSQGPALMILLDHQSIVDILGPAGLKMKTKLKQTIWMSIQQTEISSPMMTAAGLQHDGFDVVLTLFVYYQHANFERPNLVKVFPHPG